MNKDQDRCQKCFATADTVVKEAFSEQERALMRFVMLAGCCLSPTLCETPAGDFRVCHKPGLAQTDQATRATST